MTKEEQELEKLSGFHYPRYDELPEELVFLSDIVDEVNEVHAHLPKLMRKRKKPFTTSMASNYMKQGLTPQPIGRKYSREHVCRIFFAASMKLVFVADNVLLIANALFEGNDTKLVNDALSEAMDKNIESCINGETAVAHEGFDGLGQQASDIIWHVAGAFASKACALALLDEG